jgi:hypothetical protein
MPHPDEDYPRPRPTPAVTVRDGKIVARKGKQLPRFFSDNMLRVRIDSIASYDRTSGRNIEVVQKSGSFVKFDFGVGYLCDLAIAKLDAHFVIEQPEAHPCNVCSNKDVIKSSSEPSYKRTYCDFCYADERKNFKPPEAS